MSESVEAQDAAEDTAPSSLEDIAEDSEEVQTQGLNSENPKSPSDSAQSSFSQTVQAFAPYVAGTSPTVTGGAAAQAVEANPSINTVSDASTQASLDYTGASMYELAARITHPSPYRSSLPGLGTFEASPRVDNARSMTAKVPSPIIRVSPLSPTLHNRSVSSTSPVSCVSPRTEHSGKDHTSPLHSPKGPQSARDLVSPAASIKPSPTVESVVAVTPFEHALIGKAIDPSLDCVLAPNPDSEPLVRIAVPQSILEDVLAFVKARSVAQLTCDAATQTSPSPSPAPQASLVKRKADEEADMPRPSQRLRLDPAPDKVASPPPPKPQRFGYRLRRSKMVYDKYGNRDYEAMTDPKIIVLDEDDGGIEWDDPMYRELPSFFRPVTGNKKRAAKNKPQPTVAAEDKSISVEIQTAPALPSTAPEDTSLQAVDHNVNGAAQLASPPGPSTVQTGMAQTATAQTPRRAWGIGGLARSVSKFLPGFGRRVSGTTSQPQQQPVATNTQPDHLAVETPSAPPAVETPQAAESQPTEYCEHVTPQQDTHNQTSPDLGTPQSPQHRYNAQTEPRLRRRAANILKSNHAPATTRATHKKQRQRGKQSFRTIEEIAREKAARYRQRALEEENRAAQASELARKEELRNNGPRRLGEGLDNTQIGGKRKWINIDELDVIPNPPGAYGLNEDYFGQPESDEDEETPTKKATRRPSSGDEGPRRKAPRLDYGDTHVLGDPHRARPYTGVYFADLEPTFTGGNAFGHQESTSDSAREAAVEQAANTKAAEAKAAKIAAANIEAAEMRARGIWANVSSEGDIRTNKAGTFDINALCCDESDSDEEEEPRKKTPQTNSTNPSARPSNSLPNPDSSTLPTSAETSNCTPKSTTPAPSTLAGPSNNIPIFTTPAPSRSAAPSNNTARFTTSAPSMSAGPSNDSPAASNRTKRTTTASKSPRSGIAQYSVTPSTNAAAEEEAAAKRMTTARKSPKAPYLPLPSTNAEAEEEDASHKAAKPSASVARSPIPKDNPGKLPSKVNAPLTPKKKVVAVESTVKPVNTPTQPPPAPSPSHAALPNPPATIGKIDTYGLKHKPKQPSRLKQSIRYSASTVASDDGEADAGYKHSDQAQSLSAMRTDQQGNMQPNQGTMTSNIPGDANEWRSGFLQPAIELEDNASRYGYEDDQSAESPSCIIPDDDQLDSDIEEYALTYDNGLEVTAVLQNLPNAQINYREGCEPEALAYLEDEEEKLEAIRLVENGVERFVNLKEIRDEEGYDTTIDSEHVNFPPTRPNYAEAGIMDTEVYAFMQANWTDADMEAADTSFTKGLNHWKKTGELLPDDIST